MGMAASSARDPECEGVLVIIHATVMFLRCLRLLGPYREVLTCSHEPTAQFQLASDAGEFGVRDTHSWTAASAPLCKPPNDMFLSGFRPKLASIACFPKCPPSTGGVASFTKP